jgi:hypothetical protein
VGELTIEGDGSVELAYVKDVAEMARGRRTSLDEKCRSLLTLTGLLFAVTAAFTPRCPIPWLLLLPLSALLLTGFLLVEYLGVVNWTYVDPDATFARSCADARKRIHVNEILQTVRENDRTMDFLAEVFRAARQTFMVALGLVLLVAAASVALRPIEGRTVDDQLLESLRADRRLRDDLRRVLWDCPEAIGIPGPSPGTGGLVQVDSPQAPPDASMGPPSPVRHH